MILERAAELAALDRALRDAESGTGSVVMISGSRGSGKSVLLGELSRMAVSSYGARILRAHGAAMEHGFPFGIAHQLLEPVSAGTVPEVAESLPGLSALVENLCAGSIVAILVDGLQWIDTESVRLLGHLAQRLDGLRLVIAGTVGGVGYQADQLHLRGLTAAATYRVRPTNLTVESIGIMVSAYFGETCDEAFAVVCHGVTGGNPALLQAMLPGLGAAGLRPSAGDAGQVGALGPRLLLERRMSWFAGEPAAVREFAKAMVILGVQAEPELIGRLAHLDEAGRTEALLALDDLGLVADGRRPWFVHHSVEQGVEGTMTAEQRDSLRREAAGLLHGAGHPTELVAGQLLPVASELDQWAMDMLCQGAAASLRRGAPETATRYLRRALQDATDEDRPYLFVDLAVSERSFDPVSSVRHLCQAIPQLTTAGDRGAAAVMISPAAIRSGPHIARVARKTLGELGDPAHAAGAEREHAVRLAGRLRYAGSENPLELSSSIRLLRRHGRELPLSTGADRELAVVLLRAATVTGQLPSREVSRLAHRILEREPVSFTHAYTAMPLLVIIQVVADSLEDIGGWLDIALGQAQRRNAVVAEALIHAERALVFLATGQLQQAKASVTRAFDLADPEWPETAALTAIAMASVAMAARDTKLAGLVLATKHDEADLCVSAILRMLRGSVAAGRGDAAAGLDHFLASGRQLERAGWSNPALYGWRTGAISLHHRLGNVEEAAKLSEEDCERAGVWGAPAALGRALRVRASITDGPRSITLLREAVDILGGSADRLELAKTMILLGRRLDTSGEADGAKYLWQGQELATACGAAWLVEESRVESGAQAIVPGLSGRTSLTRTENTVARWALRNLTNQEIAHKLGISRRAVEKHLTNSYRKLGVEGRAGLVDALGSPNDGTSGDLN